MWGSEAEKDPDRRGFACSVGAEEGDDFAGVEGEGESVEGSGCAVTLGDGAELGDDGIGRRGGDD